MTERIPAAEYRAQAKGPRQDREGPVHRAVLQYLRLALPGAVIHHSPNETDMSGKQAARMVAKAKELGMRPGWPDIEVLWRGQFWTFEVKAPGNYPSQDQKRAGAEIIDQGGRWAVVRSAQEAGAFVEQWVDEMPEPVAMIELRGAVT